MLYSKLIHHICVSVHINFFGALDQEICTYYFDTVTVLIIITLLVLCHHIDKVFYRNEFSVSIVYVYIEFVGAWCIGKTNTWVFLLTQLLCLSLLLGSIVSPC